MSDALSIFAAAREAGPAIGLRIDERHFTFAQLAQLTRARLASLQHEARDGIPYLVTAHGTLETVVTLYALLERRVPALLLHPKLAVGERAALLHAAARGGRIAHDDAAFVVCTSATTAQPRAAVLTRAAMIASAQASAANLGWRDDDCWLLCMSPARVGGLSIITRCLIGRRAVALATKFDAHLLPAWIDAHRVTLLSLVPAMLALAFDQHPAWTAPDFLRAVLLGGATAPARLLRRAAERRVPIVITYGLTETCSQIAATPYATRYNPALHGAGQPLAGVQMRIHDGRIEVKGPMRMAGYLHEPALAREEWFDTGDLGEFDAHGCLHVHARHGDLINSGGEKVYPAEVERALEACPGVVAAGVFGAPDETWGQIVAAALVVSGRPDEAALRACLDARLAAPKRPRRFHFVTQLPLTAAGKLDRAALARMCAAINPSVGQRAAAKP